MRGALAPAIFAALLAACDASTKDGFVARPAPGQIAAAVPAANRFCPVSGDSIGSMGEAPTVIWKGRAVRLCCAGCIATFAKDPAKYAAIAAEP